MEISRILFFIIYAVLNCAEHYIQKNNRCLTLFPALHLSLQKCLKFNVDAPIWLSKQRILCTLNQSLKDVLNYGLFQPAYNGKAGKFLDEERQLREYPFPSIAPVPYLEVGIDPFVCMRHFIV